MNFFLLNVMLAFAWAIMNGSLTARDLAIGFVVGYLILWLVSPALGQPAYHERVLKIPRFAIWYLGELVRANVQVAMAVLAPRLTQHPGIVAVPLDCETDAEIAAVANLVSLTPGSVKILRISFTMFAAVKSSWINSFITSFCARILTME